MKKLLSAALAAVTIAGLMCSCQTTTEQSSVIPQSVTESSQEAVSEISQESAPDLETTIDEMLEKEKFTGVTLVVKDGAVIYNKGFNQKDDGQTFDSKSVFRIASDTKQFTAAGIMLLQQEGKLSVEDTLDKYFPDYAHGKEIKLHHLLSMRSGVPEYTAVLSEIFTNDDGVFAVSDNADENKKAILQYIFGANLMFEPNEMYTYSNSNYYLLAAIIEKVSGVTYEEYLTENIFKPLGMTSTGFFYNYAVDGAMIARSGTHNTQTEVFSKPAIAFGAGDMMSSADDIAKWLKVFEGGSILSDDTIKAMSTDYSGDSDQERYGYGFMINSDGIYHSGNLPDYTSMFFTSPNQKCSIILMTNEVSAMMMTFMNNIRYALIEN